MTCNEMHCGLFTTCKEKELHNSGVDRSGRAIEFYKSSISCPAERALLLKPLFHCPYNGDDWWRAMVKFFAEHPDLEVVHRTRLVMKSLSSKEPAQ